MGGEGRGGEGKEGEGWAGEGRWGEGSGKGRKQDWVEGELGWDAVLVEASVDPQGVVTQGQSCSRLVR